MVVMEAFVLVQAHRGQGANACTILGGRVRIAHLFWRRQVTSVPYSFRSQIAKVELPETVSQRGFLRSSHLITALVSRDRE
jgi:hypothetical protein